VSKFKCAQ
jgi:hypothetical protein